MTFYLFAFFFPSSIFLRPHFLSLHATAHTLYCGALGLYGIPVSLHICVCVCVCTRIKPTSILRGSRGKKAPLRPLGEGIPFVWGFPPPLWPIDTEADRLWFSVVVERKKTGLLSHPRPVCVCVCVFVWHCCSSVFVYVLCGHVGTLEGHCLSV